MSQLPAFFICLLVPICPLCTNAQVHTPLKQTAPPLALAQQNPVAGKEIYIAIGDRNNDYTSNDSQYSSYRQVETPDIALFWDKIYGDDPTNNPDPTKRFNVNEVLQETQRYYDYYVNVLKFVEKGNSVTDKYKALVYVTYNKNDDGTAYGSGADKKIGIFWTPSSRISKGPYGVVAHELGHSFQYLVGANGGWGFGSGGPIWEMTSQYMLWQVLPEWMTFENYHLKDFMKQTHLAFLHEDNQYHSPYVLEYWSNKRGLDFVGQLWRRSQKGEDAVMTYKRLTGLDQKAFNDEMFDAARHFITWDMKRIEKVAAPYANQHTSALDAIGNGWYRIAASRRPQNYGYNGIRLQVPPAGTKVTLDFKGIAGAEGFRAIHVDKAGWRYGFVASKEDGSREYSPIYSASEGTAGFTTPVGTKYLWLVVSGAPTEHWEHIADNDALTDEQWPYQFKLSGTSPDASTLDVSTRDPAVEKALATDIELWDEIQKLAPLETAIKVGNLGEVTQAFKALQDQNVSALILETARVQIATLNNTPLPIPAEVEANSLFLSEAKPSVAEVGWLQPTYNRLPDEGNPTIFMVGSQLFARGIYAHAPARHVYNLGGKWMHFTGAAGVERGKSGRVGFKILADGKEIWKSGPLEGSNLATFNLSVKDVQSLELLTDDGGNGPNSDWGLWLNPTLTR